MNVLLFVTSLLMVMALMTYARMDMYRYFTLTQAEFERYMRYIERNYSNQTAQNYYDSTKANTRGPAPGQQPPPQQPQNPDSTPVTPPQDQNQPGQNGQQSSSSRLNIRILIDPTARTTSGNAYNQVKQYTKNLMYVLYGQQRFFQLMMQTRPNFIDEIFESLTQAIQALPEKQRPNKANELANIRIEPGLEEVFYLMLKGCPTLDLEEAMKPPPPPPQSEFYAHPEQVLPDDEADDAQEAQEYYTAKGFSSLLNYVTMTKSPTSKIRVYLASRELLLAIFGQPDVVENIIQMRHNLYNQVRSGSLPPEEATNQFGTQFRGAIREGDDSLLDFKVTKTNPAEYD